MLLLNLFVAVGNIIVSVRFCEEVVERVTYARMRTPMRTARMSRYPNIPHSLEDLSRIMLNPQYRVITISDDGTDNIYAGSVTDGNGDHHILFASRRQLRLMKTFRVLHSDGTFKVVPGDKHFADQVSFLWMKSPL